ncbi:MAG TPA: PHP domain-containing protein [Candidatus Tenderia sp.]|nr:PHP domain-containing protein [Candidatus Tenderia sp.]
MSAKNYPNPDKKYDLHSHSTASDGELTPTELVEYALECGVDVLALTDHDDTSGFQEAARAAQKGDIELIAGVEISTTWNKRLVHIVGLNIDPSAPALQAGLENLRGQRMERGARMAERLEKRGIPDALAGARQFSNGNILSRTHFARYLVEAGYVKNVNDAFKRHLGDGKPAYVASDWAELDEVVGWINAAGGVAVIAHPARYKLSATRLRLLIEDFKACGGVGLEVVSGSQDKKDTRNMAEYARRYGLHASVGSDYHGPAQSWSGMGKQPPLPEGCIPIWQLWENHQS